MHKEYAGKYPESFDKNIPAKLIYSGKMKLTDKTEIEGIDVGKLLLSPTRTYAPVIKEILRKYRKQIHGIVHCSGGGQTKVLNFIDKLHVVKDNMFPVPPLFQMIQEQSGTDWSEMYRVFNMGHRMELYVPEKIAESIIKTSENFNVGARIIGHCENSNKKALTIKAYQGNYHY